MPEVIKIEDTDKLVPTKNFKYGSWDFDEFNPVQSKLFEVYEGDSNVAIAAATSAGKTVCAEMYMSYEVRKRGGKAIYVGPLKALAKEKELDWTDPKHHFNDLNIEIITGDFRFTSSRIEELEDSDVIVMTPEMLASRSRNSDSDKSAFLKGVGTVVFDESHLLTVPRRGDHIEVALMKLMSLNPNIRIVLLSATMPNVDEICGWVTEMSGRDTYYLESDYRPCPLKTHYEVYYDGDKMYDDKEIQKIGTACGIVEYYPDDKFLIFVHTKRTGKQMVEHLTRYGIESEFHNADLDLKSRLKLEDKFKNDPKFRVVVATSTLAWGLNLPARRVIVTGVHRGLSVVENYDIQQMIGRAGRPKYDPSGDAYILIPESEKKIWMDSLRNKSEIKSTLLDAVGTPDNPHYKTLAFHIVSEIHQGNVTTKEGFHDWFSKSLAHYQSHGFDDSVIDQTIALLEQKNAVYIDEQGEYKVTSIGKIASMYYYSPFDVSDLKRNFKHLFEKGHDKNDHAIALALGNIDSNKWGIVNKHEKRLIESFETKTDKEFGSFYTSCAVKYAYVYHNMLKGRKDPAFQALQGGIMNDMDRMMQVLSLVDSMSGKWDRSAWFKMLRLRLWHGVGEDLIHLVQIPNVGQVRANRLKKAGIKDLDSFLNKSPDKLADIMKCSKKLATEAVEGARDIKLKEMVGMD